MNEVLEIMKADAVVLVAQLRRSTYPYPFSAILDHACEVLERLMSASGDRLLIAERDAESCILDLRDARFNTKDEGLKEVSYQCMTLLGILATRKVDAVTGLSESLDEFGLFLKVHKHNCPR